MEGPSAGDVTSPATGAVGVDRASFTPNPVNVLGAIAEVRTSAPARVAVRVTGPGVDGRETAWSAWGLDHRVEVVGLRAESTYELAAVVDHGDGVEPEVWASTSFRTGALPADVPTIDVSTLDRAAVPDGLTIFSAWEDTVTADQVAFVGVDADGEIVWYWQAPGVPKPGYATQTADGHLFMVVPDAIREITPGGQLVAALPVLDAGFHHDGVRLPNGNWLILGSEQRSLDTDGDDVAEGVVGDTVLELDETGAVVWRWSTFDHLPTQRFPGPLSREESRLTPGLDWTHGNALVYLPDEDAFLVSLRNQHWIVKVDRASGDVLWRMGEGGDFTLREGDSWFYGQHAPELQPDGTMLVYDNGNERPDPALASRVVRVAFDEDEHTAAIVWQAPLGVYTPQLGGASRIDADRVLACAGAWTTDASSGEKFSTLSELRVHDGAPIRQLHVNGLVYRATHVPGFWRAD